MKSYLSLIPISAKVRKRQNLMTILCIVISVFLVTTIFSVVDMIIRAESENLKEKHGTWHIRFENISTDIADEISRRPDVAEAGWLETFNSDADQPYYINGKKAVLCGTDSVYMTQLIHAVEEGAFPQNDHEVMLSSNARLALDVQVGDSITLQSPSAEAVFTVSGFGSDDKEYYQGQTYQVAVYLTRPAFAGFMGQNGILGNPACYIRFQNVSNVSAAKKEIRERYGLPEESISENTAVMGLAGQSSNKSVGNIYAIAFMLFILVLLAGVMMISGSMNSNVAQRTKFFGMMRCIGASRRQIIRFVQLEALNWCKTAVPIGLIFGTAVSWSVCAMLRYGIGGEFANVQVFALSPVGLVCGAAVGVVTVLLAARSPARRAAKVSPIAAVSGNAQASSVQHMFKVNLGKIETTLGVHHATASRKNWFLMTASFSLSIILFLCFSIGLDFARELLPSMRSWQPDLVLNGYANERVLGKRLGNTIRLMSGVDSVWGIAYAEHVPAVSSRQGIDHVNLVSYSGELLDSAQESLVYGDLSEIYGESDQVITVINKDNPLQVGDTVEIAGKEVKITCSLSSGLFPSEYSIICSQETFERLTGEQNYSMIGIQLGEDATDETIREISSLAESDVIFSDMRESNQEDARTYLSMGVVMYCFLAVIAMITMFYIVNSVSMGVTARIKQYGAMRAVGMDSGQVTRMIVAEAFTYAVSGLVVGCGAGIALSRFLHIMLLTRYFGTPWKLPVIMIGIIVLFDVVSVAAAVYAPAKRIRTMAITDTINEL